MKLFIARHAIMWLSMTRHDKTRQKHMTDCQQVVNTVEQCNVQQQYYIQWL